MFSKTIKWINLKKTNKIIQNADDDSNNGIFTNNEQDTISNTQTLILMAKKGFRFNCGDNSIRNIYIGTNNFINTKNINSVQHPEMYWDIFYKWIYVYLFFG